MSVPMIEDQCLLRNDFATLSNTEREMRISSLVALDSQPEQPTEKRNIMFVFLSHLYGLHTLILSLPLHFILLMQLTKSRVRVAYNNGEYSKFFSHSYTAYISYLFLSLLLVCFYVLRYASRKYSEKICRGCKWCAVVYEHALCVSSIITLLVLRIVLCFQRDEWKIIGPLPFRFSIITATNILLILAVLSLVALVASRIVLIRFWDSRLRAVQNNLVLDLFLEVLHSVYSFKKVEVLVGVSKEELTVKYKHLHSSPETEPCSGVISLADGANISEPSKTTQSLKALMISEFLRQKRAEFVRLSHYNQKERSMCENVRLLTEYFKQNPEDEKEAEEYNKMREETFSWICELSGLDCSVGKVMAKVQGYGPILSRIAVKQKLTYIDLKSCEELYSSLRGILTGVALFAAFFVTIAC